MTTPNASRGWSTKPSNLWVTAPQPFLSLEACEVENGCDDTALCWRGMRQTQDWFMVQSGGNTWVWHDDHRAITKSETLNSALLHIICDCFTVHDRIKCGHLRGHAAENEVSKIPDTRFFLYRTGKINYLSICPSHFKDTFCSTIWFGNSSNRVVRSLHPSWSP